MGAIHLVRHGQASWGSDDYDVLSERGVEQSRQLGHAWEAAGWLPTYAVSGAMKRHHDTALSTLATAGQDDGYEVDRGWDEFDHKAIMDAYFPQLATKDPREFQQAFVEATTKWIAGEGNGEYESYDSFSGRVLDGLERAVSAVDSGQSVVIFTSGGPIAVVASYLLAGDMSLWSRMNSVIINTGVTTVVTGRSGKTLLSFNEHGHLPADLITYR